MLSPLTKAILCPVLLLGACLSTARSATYIVDQAATSHAKDADGSADKPFATISAAAKKVGAGDRVLIRPGVYRESVRVAASGTKDRPIVFEAEKPGTVFLSGADPLGNWTRHDPAKPIYRTSWPHDFFVSAKGPDGQRLRHFPKHKPPLGLPELVVWDGRALKTVLKPEDLTPGTFCIDYDRDELYVWLPNGADPNTTEVLGATRQRIFGPDVTQKDESKGHYITVRNLTFQHAANFSGGNHQAGVSTNTGWVMEDCVVQWCNAMGLNVTGHDVKVLRTVAEHNGHSGFVGSGQGILIKDCVNRYNNWKGFSPTGSGSTKFVRMNKLVLDGFQSYGNVGKGIWLDIDNRECEIVNCVVYGNRGLRAPFEAAGIFVEIGYGPIRIANNTVYSNTGGGLRVAESENVVIENNISVDNGEALELRAMTNRGDYKLGNVVIRNNLFKDWRRVAVSTSLGDWDTQSARTKNIVMEGNIYDPPKGKPFFEWAKKEYATLKEAQATLGFEQNAKIKQVKFDRELIATRPVNDEGLVSFAKLLSDAKSGSVVVLPANGRTSLVKVSKGWTCQVYDLRNGFVQVTIPDEKLRAAVEQIQEWPETVPVNVKVRLTSVGAGGAEATVLAVEK